MPLWARGPRGSASPRVLGGRHRLQMGGIETSPIAAQVVYVETIRDRPDPQCVGDAVDEDLASSSDPAVSVRVDRTGVVPAAVLVDTAAAKEDRLQGIGGDVPAVLGFEVCNLDARPVPAGVDDAFIGGDRSVGELVGDAVGKPVPAVNADETPPLVVEDSRPQEAIPNSTDIGERVDRAGGFIEINPLRGHDVTSSGAIHQDLAPRHQCQPHVHHGGRSPQPVLQ